MQNLTKYYIIRQIPVPITRKRAHGLSRFVEERVEQSPAAHQEQPLQSRQVLFKPGHVDQ